jgi:hypothetical protein
MAPTPKGQRARAVQQAAEAAGVNIDLSEYGERISQKELNKINARLERAGVNPVDFERTKAGQTGYVYESGLPTKKEDEGPGEDPNIVYQRQRDDAERVSAYQILIDTFKGYGLETLVPVLQSYMENKTPYAEGLIRLRQSDAYKARFSGNEGRIARGLAAYQPDEYLAAEETYREIFAQNNLEGLMTQDTFSKLISGAVSPVEAQDRIAKVFNKIDNADDTLKQELNKQFALFGVGDPAKQRGEIATALLMGQEASQMLERRLSKAQISAGAALSKYTVDSIKVEDLQKQFESAGVSDVYGTAKAGFRTLAEAEPTVSKLAEIYKTDTSGLQKELQQEAFFGLKSQRRKRLEEQEKATFAGQAGTTQVSLAQRTAGQF